MPIPAIFTQPETLNRADLFDLDWSPEARLERLADRDWNRLAACRTPRPTPQEPFFESGEYDDAPREPRAQKRKRLALARRVCSGCPVTVRCLVDALDYESQAGRMRAGVWGGTDETERDRLWKDLGFTSRRSTERAA